MSFKSYGNVPNGVATVARVDTTKLLNLEGHFSFKWSNPPYYSSHITAKAARAVGDNVVVLLWGEGSLQASLVMLKGSDGTKIWGPIDYGTVHGEGTDIAVSSDNTLIAISGQGGTANPKTINARMTLVKASDNQSLYYQLLGRCYSKHRLPRVWGIVAFPNLGGFSMACGTGIEGGTCAKLSGTDKTNCEAGKGDTRAGAYPRKENVWQSYVIRTDAAGKQLWARVDSYKDPEWPTLENGGGTASSASEYAIITSNGDLALVNDEVNGVGLLKLGSSFGLKHSFAVL